MPSKPPSSPPRGHAADTATDKPIRDAGPDKRQPPASARRTPGPGEPCGDFDIRIARDGTWYHEGTPIGRPALVKLFATVLRREADGSYWLVTPAERGTIVVDDAPFLAVEVTREPGPRGDRLVFRTNIDQRLVAGEAHPIRVAIDAETGEPSPYIMVDRERRLEALIARPVFYELVELAEERVVEDGKALLGVWSEGRFFPLGSAEPTG